MGVWVVTDGTNGGAYCESMERAISELELFGYTQENDTTWRRFTRHPYTGEFRWEFAHVYTEDTFKA